MKRNTTVAIIAAVLLTGASFVTATAAPVQAKSKQAQQNKLQRQAKITMDQARETALQRAPGTVEDSELEREHGQLVYSFDIRNSKGTIDEIQVSAITGKIVRVEHENKKQENAEKRRDSQKH